MIPLKKTILFVTSTYKYVDKNLYNVIYMQNGKIEKKNDFINKFLAEEIQK